MTTPKTILAATDFSDSSAVALDEARGFARAFGATLHVLHVTDDLLKRYVRGGAIDLPPELQADIEGAAQTEVERLVSEQDRRELHAVAAVRTSDHPADAIVEYAQGAKVDLIVVGSHGRRGLAHALLGSIAEKVARTAPCPVLIVRRPQAAA
jgi:nucleotide-binding universal stress UspA family protein